jgi:hypothetical protein
LVRGVHTQLAIGDAALTVTANGAVELAGAGNPTQWYRSRDNAVTLAEDFGSLPSGQGYFSTQTQSTALSVIATGGNVTLWNDSLTTFNASKAAWTGMNTNYVAEATDPFIYYPGITKIVAASSDINIVNGMLVLPNAKGNLDLWAQGSLNLRLRSKEGYERLLAVGSMVPGHFGTPTVPNQSPTGSWYGAPVSGGQTALTSILHAGDYEPSRFYAVDGDIVAGEANLNAGTAPFVYVGEQAWFRAGHDVVNLNLRAQNSHPQLRGESWAGRHRPRRRTDAEIREGAAGRQYRRRLHRWHHRCELRLRRLDRALRNRKLDGGGRHRRRVRRHHRRQCAALCALPRT